MYLCTCKTTLDLHEFGFTRGRTKTGVGGGGEEGMQSKGHICTCPVLLHCFGDICQQVACGWGGGGGDGNCCQRGAMGEWGGGGGGAAGPHPQGYA